MKQQEQVREYNNVKTIREHQKRDYIKETLKPIYSEEFKKDEINNPAHYTFSNIEPLDVMKAWNLPMHLCQVLKYIARYRYKGTPDKDLKKAQFYLNDFIRWKNGE